MKKRHKRSSIEIYLPDYTSNTINAQFALEDKLSNNKKLKVNSIENKVSLNEILCQAIGYDGKDLPWNQLRALQLSLTEDSSTKFNLNQSILNSDRQHTLACCDPVMMQVTHRGAYLWGQDSLNFSTEEVIKIIAQINKQLMEEGEGFYLLNNKQWLYVNEKEIELDQQTFEYEVGRDQFGFSYNGKQSDFWNRLATEIQMLIKQMIDYGGLSGVPPESLVNVHFWGNSKKQLYSTIKTNHDFNLFSNDDFIKLFCKTSKTKCENLMSLDDLIALDVLIETDSDKKIVIGSYSNSHGGADTDRDWLDLMINDISVIAIKSSLRFKTIKLILQDRTVEIKQKQSFLQRFFND